MKRRKRVAIGKLPEGGPMSAKHSTYKENVGVCGLLGLGELSVSLVWLGELRVPPTPSRSSINEKWESFGELGDYQC